MNHKRRRPKNRRAGCLLCKPHKRNGADRRTLQEVKADERDLLEPMIVDGHGREMEVRRIREAVHTAVLPDERTGSLLLDEHDPAMLEWHLDEIVKAMYA